MYLPGKDYYDPPHYPDHPDMRESDPYLERPPLPRNLNNFRAQVIHYSFHHNHHHHNDLAGGGGQVVQQRGAPQGGNAQEHKHRVRAAGQVVLINFN